MGFFKRIGSTKTFKFGVAGLLGLIAAVMTGEMAVVEAAQAAIPLLASIFIRDGIAKGGA